MVMNEKIGKIARFIQNPGLLIMSLGHREMFKWVPDETYLKVIYRIKMGKKLNLDPPVTFNEKLQWLKLHDRRPGYSLMVDKYEAKKYVAGIIGEQYIIPTLGVWDRFDDIDFDSLPDQFVLKCTHDSGGSVICRDKARFDIKSARRKISKCLKHNFFWGQREWPYKDIKPRIIAEKYMEDPSTKDLRDYKLFTFDGIVKALLVATDRQEQHKETKFDYYDAEFRHLPFTREHPNAAAPPSKPVCFEEMKRLAEKLSQNIPQLRVDFYEVTGKIYFGELTFMSGSGLTPFEPEEWDYTFGSWLKLPQK